MPTRSILVVGPFDTWAELLVPAVIGLLLAAGVVGLVSAVRQFRRGATILRSDPIDAGSVYLADDDVELEGEVEGVDGEQCTTRYTDRPCVAHEYETKERERRRGPDGDTRTTYDTVESGSDAVPFYLRDQSGRVLVDPAGATLSLDTETISAGAVRKYEGVLHVGDVVHVYGQKRDAVEADDVRHGEDTYVGDGDAIADFMISDTTEHRTALRYGLSATGRLLFFCVWTGIWGLLLLQTLDGGTADTVATVDAIRESVRSLLP